jgi:ATP-dependent Lon protease
MIQLRLMDADKSGAGLDVPVLLAFVGALLERNTRGGTMVVGPLDLGCSIEKLPDPVVIAEGVVENRAATQLMLVSARRALNELPDELWTRVSIESYKDLADAVFKGLTE